MAKDDGWEVGDGGGLCAFFFPLLLLVVILLLQWSDSNGFVLKGMQKDIFL